LFSCVDPVQALSIDRYWCGYSWKDWRIAMLAEDWRIALLAEHSFVLDPMRCGEPVPSLVYFGGLLLFVET